MKALTERGGRAVNLERAEIKTYGNPSQTNNTQRETKQKKQQQKQLIQNRGIKKKKKYPKAYNQNLKHKGWHRANPY